MTKHYPEYQFNSPVKPEVLAEVASVLRIPLDYQSFLESANGGFGFIGEDYVILTKVEELIATNTDYRVTELFPGILLIGNNGGSEAIAIDQRTIRNQYVLIPFLFEEDAIIHLGNSFEEMLDHIENKGFFG